MDPAYSWDNYNRYLAYAIRGVRDLSIHAATPKSTYLTLDNAKVATLPNDFMRLSKLGIVVDGRIEMLTVDPHIVSPKGTLWTCENGEVTTTPPPGTNTPVQYFTPFTTGYGLNYGWPQAIYGYGKGKNPTGLYRIDYNNRQIQFSSNVTEGTEGLVMEYITNGLATEPDGHTYIDERAFEAVEAWIKWKEEEGKPSQKAKAIDRSYWRTRYQSAKADYITSKFGMTMQDLTWFTDSAYSLTPNRPML